MNEMELLSMRGAGGVKEIGRGTKAGTMDGKLWCEDHKTNSHNTVDCRSGPKATSKIWLPAEEYKKKKDLERKQKGLVSAHAENGLIEEGDVPMAGQASEFALSSRLASEAIIIDSGATNNFIKDSKLLSDLVKLATPISIEVGDGKKVQATHRGRLSFKSIYFDDSYYVPDMAHNLLSVHRMGPNDSGLKWTFSKSEGSRLVNKTGKPLLQGKWDETKVWIVSEAPVRMTSSLEHAFHLSDSSDIIQGHLLHWHKRLGHADMKTVWKLGQAGMLDGTRNWNGNLNNAECMECLQGKATRAASSANPRRATRPLVNISVDLWGPATTRSRNGYHYFLTCYDDFSVTE